MLLYFTYVVRSRVFMFLFKVISVIPFICFSYWCIILMFVYISSGLAVGRTGKWGGGAISNTFKRTEKPDAIGSSQV